MKRYGLAAAILAGVIGSPAWAEDTTPGPADLARAMIGSFATLPGDAENNFAETRFLFTNPALLAALADGQEEAVLVYSSLLSGPERKPYRRRVTVISRADGVIRTSAFAFVDGSRFADGLPSPEALAAILPDDLARGIAAAEGADCAMRWTPGVKPAHWRGYIAPVDCRLWSERRGAFIALEAETRLSPGRIEQTERGFDEAGKVLFGTAPGVFIVQVATERP